MKIGIITYWNSNDNYGQQLQYFATQTFLKALGHEAFLVRYVSQYKRKRKNIFKQIAKLFKPQYIKYAISIFAIPIKNKFINTFYQNHYIDRKFEIFRDKYFNTSCHYTEKELYTNPPKADLFLCGSDQIWSGAGFDKIYFLDFTDLPKIAWSCSFGRNLSSLSELEKSQTSSLIKNFKHITVRENEAIKICNALGRNDVELMCDPTLLNNVDKYLDIIDPSIDTQDSVFVYYLGHKTYISDNQIYKYFKRSGIKTTFTSSQGIINRIPKIFPTIEEWLGCIKNANFVITNSFHGTIFCLLFNKNFAVIPLKIEGANTRITTLLNSIGLENRICRTISELDKIYKTPIDYNKVNTKVNSLRENGIITAMRLLSTI